MISREHLAAILELGVTAPSGGNSQPWRFVASAQEVQVFSTPEKDLPLLNFEDKGTLIAHGALLENIRIAATGAGYRTEIRVDTELTPGTPVARIQFEPAKTAAHPLYEAIQKRCTNRRPYDKSELSGDDRRVLLDSIDESVEAELMFAESQPQKSRIGDAIGADLPIVMAANRQIHDRFFEEIVWTQQEELARRSGLYLPTMELAAPQRAVLRMLRNWKVMRAARAIGLPRAIAKANGKLWSNAAAFGAVVIRDTSRRRYVSIGMLIERLWLTATARNLSLHPIVGVLFLTDRIRSGDTSQLSAAEVRSIQTAYAAIEEAFAVRSGHVAFLFRIGRAKPPSATCSRILPQVEWNASASA